LRESRIARRPGRAAGGSEDATVWVWCHCRCGAWLSHAADAVLVILSTPACCSCWCCARVAFANFLAVAVACFAARFPRGPKWPLRMNLPCFAAGLPVVQCSLALPLEGCWNSNESIIKIRAWARSFESPPGRPLIRPLRARGPPLRRAQGVQEGQACVLPEGRRLRWQRQGGVGRPRAGRRRRPTILTILLQRFIDGSRHGSTGPGQA
jgi:hypothetical protein